MLILDSRIRFCRFGPYITKYILPLNIALLRTNTHELELYHTVAQQCLRRTQKIQIKVHEYASTRTAIGRIQLLLVHQSSGKTRYAEEDRVEWVSSICERSSGWVAGMRCTGGSAWGGSQGCGPVVAMCGMTIQLGTGVGSMAKAV